MDSAEIAEAVAETSQTAFLPLFEFQQINSCDRSGVTPEYWEVADGTPQERGVSCEVILLERKPCW